MAINMLRRPDRKSRAGVKASREKVVPRTFPEAAGGQVEIARLLQRATNPAPSPDIVRASLLHPLQHKSRTRPPLLASLVPVNNRLGRKGQ